MKRNVTSLTYDNVNMSEYAITFYQKRKFLTSLLYFPKKIYTHYTPNGGRNEQKTAFSKYLDTFCCISVIEDHFMHLFLRMKSGCVLARNLFNLQGEKWSDRTPVTLFKYTGICFM